MAHFLQFGLSNAVAAAVLAVLAAVATRVWRNPHFAYALWLVVLLRLVAPPLLPVGVPVPEWMAGNSREPLPVVSESETVIRPPVGISASIAQSTGGPKLPPVAPEPDRPDLSTRAGDVRVSEFVAQAPLPEDRGDPEGAPPRGSLGMSQDVSTGVSQLSAFRWPSMANLVAVAWLSGTLCYLLLTALRVRRFARVLQRARREVPAGVAAEAAEVAAAVGLRRVPRLAFAEAALPPMVWPGWRSVVLLPKALFTSLGADARRLLLWHEFLHLRRRDHLVRWFEVGIVGLYWWNPVAWWAVARLQQAEEDCCDAAVLVAHPHESARYGETLVSVAQFLSTGTLPTPSLSVGVARNQHIKRRLAMILHGPRWPELSKTRLAAFSLLGAALVAVTWTAAKAQTAPAAPAASVESPFAPKPGETAVADGLAKPQSERPDVQIDEILVEGNVRIPTADILQKLNLQTGRKVPQIRIDEGLYALMQTRQFFSVIPKYRHTDKKSTVILVVAERPLTKSVSYLGAREFDTKSLAAAIQFEVGRPYNVSDNKHAVRRLEDFYRNQGYREATVKLIKGDKPEDRDVVFRIHEGVGRKVVSPLFVGNNAVSYERLARVLKSSPVYVFNGVRLEPANVIGDVAAVRKFYADLGFFDATVTPKIEYGQNRGRVSLKYTVHEGQPYRIRHFSMTGNIRSKSDVLLKTIKTREGQFYDASQIREDLEKFKQAYEALEHTHLNVEIVPSFPQEPAVIDLVLRVEMTQNENGNSSLSMPGPRPAADAAPPANKSAASSIRLSPTLTVPDTRDVPLSQIKEMQPAAGDDELRKLQKQRFNAALRELKLSESQFDLDATQMSAVCQATRKVFEAWKALAQQPADELRAVDWYVGYTNRLWNGAHDRYLAGRAAGFDWGGEAEARAARLEAQIESMKLQQRFEAKTGGAVREQILHDLQQQATAATEVGPASTRGRPIETALEARHESVFTAVKRPSGSRFLLDLMYPMRIEAGAWDNETRRLLKEKYNAAARAMQVYQKQWETGNLDLVAQIDNLLAAARNLRDAELALDQRQGIQLGVLETYLDFTRYLEQAADGWVKTGVVAGVDAPVTAARMRGARADAELRVQRVQRDMAQRELRNPTAFLKTEPANTVPTGKSPAVPEPAIVANRPKNDRLLPLYLKHPDQMPLLPTDDSRQRWRKETYNAAAQAMDAYQLRWREGNFDLAAHIENIEAAVLKLRDAELALCPDAESILGTLGKYLEFVRSLQKFASVWVNSDGSVGVSTPLGDAHMRRECVDMQFKMAKLIREQAEKEREKLPPAAISGSPSDSGVVSPSDLGPGSPPATKPEKPAPPVPKASTERLPLLLTRPPLERQANDDQWHKLLKERFNAAVRGLQASYRRHEIDTSTTSTNVIAAARRVLEADLALTVDPEYSKQEKQSAVDAWQRYFELMKFLEQKAEARFKARMAGQDELEAAHEARLDAELKLLEAQRAKAAPPDAVGPT